MAGKVQAVRAAQNWGPIALSNGMLLIRDKSRLMCVRVTK
jgi:hypothetical protein